MTDHLKLINQCEFCGGTGINYAVHHEEGQGEELVEEDCSHCSGTGRRSEGYISFYSDVYPTYAILDATDASEYNNLSDANQEAYRMILSCGMADLSEGTATRTKLWNIFGEGTTTRTNLEALING